MNNFALLINKYFNDYLVSMRNVSKNTILSYRDTMVLLINYLYKIKNIKPEQIKLENLTAEIISEFLSWLEVEKNCSITTRNQRLAAIRSFFRYISIQSPEYLFLVQQILNIPNKKVHRTEIKYLSIEQTQELLSKPNISEKNGLRDTAILCLLYDSGCRVQELVDIKVKDIRFGQLPQITLHGKGNKTRSVPLMKETVSIIKEYIISKKLDQYSKLDTPLFFNVNGLKLTRQGVTYILKKYGSQMELSFITPHQIRHTKGMHLAEAEINPIYIRDFLGHCDFKTTQIYAKSSVELKRKAFEKLQKDILPESNDTTKKRDWIKDKELLNWLNSLGK